MNDKYIYFQSACEMIAYCMFATNPIFSWIVSTFTYVYTMVIEKNIQYIYLNGPRFYGWGAWGGMDVCDICQEMTGVSSQHWLQHKNDCEEIIQQKLTSILIVLWILLFASTCYKCTYFVVSMYIIEPMKEKRNIRFMEKRLELYCQYQRMYKLANETVPSAFVLNE